MTGTSGTYRILLVDDDAAVRWALGDLLRSQGHEVTDAGSGAEALACVDAGVLLDVVVTDLRMPGMDGRQLMGAIRERRPGLPVVIVTGSDPALPGRRRDEPEPDALLIKPLHLDALAAALRAVVGCRPRPDQPPA